MRRLIRNRKGNRNGNGNRNRTGDSSGNGNRTRTGTSRNRKVKGPIMATVTGTGKGPGTGSLTVTVGQLHTHGHSEIKRLGNMRFPFSFFYISPQSHSNAWQGTASYLLEIRCVVGFESVRTSKNYNSGKTRQAVYVLA
jgi:hypothetical protein